MSSINQIWNLRNVYPIIDQAQKGLSEGSGSNFAMDFSSTVLAQGFRELQSGHVPTGKVRYGERVKLNISVSMSKSFCHCSD